ncbi:UNVERIFIED_CONTAM: hypothetical protein FKN15_052221 [Acipenser sinensis]
MMTGSSETGSAAAEKVTSLGKDWHKFCLKCERCNKTLTAGGHAEHDGKPFCHKPCYAALFGPKGVNIGGAGAYVYDNPPVNSQQTSAAVESAPKTEERKTSGPPRGPVKGVNTGGVGSYIYEKDPSTEAQP